MRHTISARTPKRVPHDASSFAMPLPLPVIPDLPTTLQLLLDQIPCGQVATYGGLADALGCRTAARWVGEYLRDHPHTARCVCHRVVRIDGSIGLYVTGSSDEKARKLQSEGVLIQDGR
ncbi:MAG: MGMT family protein, partial [Planctomycetaceae bacterium]